MLAEETRLGISVWRFESCATAARGVVHDDSESRTTISTRCAAFAGSPLRIGCTITPRIRTSIIRNSSNYYSQLNELYKKFPELGLELLFTVSLYDSVKQILFASTKSISSKNLSQIIQEFKFHNVQDTSPEVRTQILNLLESSPSYETFTRNLRCIILGTTMQEDQSADLRVEIRRELETSLSKQYSVYRSSLSAKYKKYFIGLLKKKISRADYQTIVGIIDE